jgi:hypothetical protein
MARKERPGEKLIDDRLRDKRYKKPLDARAQERRLKKGLRNLREL